MPGPGAASGHDKTGNMDIGGTAAIGRRLTKWPLIVFTAVLLTAFNAVANQGVTREPRQFFFSQSFMDLPEELQSAKAQGKQGILLFFEAEDCKYCRAMLKGVLSQKQVQDWYQKHFINIAIDIHGDVEIRDLDGITLPSKVFSSHRQVFMTPVLSFLDLDGVEIYRHLGMVTTVEEFMVMGEYIVGQHYFDTEFKVFAKQQGMQKNDANGSPPMTGHIN